MRHSIAICAAICLLPTMLFAKEIQPKASLLSLQDAITKALQTSPQLKAAEAALFAAKGEHRQAKLLPNPELSVDTENFAGDRQYKGLDNAEVTYGISQPLEIGGKRSARSAIGKQGVALATYTYQAAKLDVVRDVTIAYYEAIAAKEYVQLAEEQEKLASNVLATVTERVQAAAEPIIQQSKASVALASSQISADNARRDYEAARRHLATLWGSAADDFALDSHAFFTLTKPSSFAQKDAALNGNPDLLRLRTEQSYSEALLRLEKANALPDPRINVGIRDFKESHDHALVAGVSMPLPVFNRNQGNIAKAHHNVRKAEHEKKAAELTLLNRLLQSEQELTTSYRQALRLRETILKDATASFEWAEKNYRAGKFPYLEVLDAQRTLFEVKEHYYQALKTYHVAAAELARLTPNTTPPSTRNAHEN